MTDSAYHYIHLDVFTDALFGGNQLAVFLEPKGLADEMLQSIAREMNFSETTFVYPPQDTGTDIRLRIFTPSEELPMAGHPTIGTAFALAHTGAIVPGRREVVFGEGIGPVRVELEWDRGGLQFAWMTQRPPEFGPALADPALAGAAIGVSADAVERDLPIQVVSCGLPFLFVPLRTRASVDSARPNPDGIEHMSRQLGALVLPVFLFSTETGADGATAYSRMFAPGFGIAEDPATGGASGPLGCYLVRHGLIAAERADAIVSLQGVVMGRPSRIHIDIGVDRGSITRVRVGGRAVTAGEGTLFCSGE